MEPRHALSLRPGALHRCAVSGRVPAALHALARRRVLFDGQAPGAATVAGRRGLLLGGRGHAGSGARQGCGRADRRGAPAGQTHRVHRERLRQHRHRTRRQARLRPALAQQARPQTQLAGAVLGAPAGFPHRISDSEAGAAEPHPELRRRLSRRGNRQQHLAHGARSGHRSHRPLEGLHAHARPAISERRLRNRRSRSTRRACSTPKGC